MKYIGTANEIHSSTQSNTFDYVMYYGIRVGKPMVLIMG